MEPYVAFWAQLLVCVLLGCTSVLAALGTAWLGFHLWFSSWGS